MKPEPDDLRILRLRKKWADGFTLLWQVMIVLLFIGVYFLLEQSGIEAAESTGAFVLLATIVPAAAVWQAVGRRTHSYGTQGIDLEVRPRSKV